MIFDKIENAHLYAKTHAGINKALNYLKNTNFLELANGKHEIEGDAIFAIVNEYETKKTSFTNTDWHRPVFGIICTIRAN